MLNNLLDLNPVSHVRRNHALEHATLSILAKKNPKLSLVGNSDVRGFWVFGDVSTEELQQAVDEAAQRLKQGEANLAIHPYCGTNFVTAGVVAGSAAWLGMIGSGGGGLRRKLDRLPIVVSLVTLGLMVAQPLGPLMQARVTTDAAIGELKVYEITEFKRGEMLVHRVKTRN